MRINFKKYNFGFTLAEVLITLVIIGVIAAITVPTLINKTNNQEYVSKLKKAYSTLSQATNQIISEEGQATNWATSADNIYNLYLKKLNNAKKCDGNQGCFKQGQYYKLNTKEKDSSNWDTITSHRKFILSDGTQVLIPSNSFISTNCSLNNQNNNGSNNVCAFMHVDINGVKGPNEFGKDNFVFVLKRNGLYPAGCDIDGLCITGTLGLSCACKVLREGAMNY